MVIPKNTAQALVTPFYYFKFILCVSFDPNAVYHILSEGSLSTRRAVMTNGAARCDNETWNLIQENFFKIDLIARVHKVKIQGTIQQSTQDDDELNQLQIGLLNISQVDDREVMTFYMMTFSNSKHNPLILLTKLEEKWNEEYEDSGLELFQEFQTKPLVEVYSATNWKGLGHLSEELSDRIDAIKFD
eukprot:jgi/Psemu1/1381/gm1.1381_g